MLFKTTLRYLLVTTSTNELLVPIVANSYKRTLWLLKHRHPEAKAIGVIEGAFADLSFLQVGAVAITNIHTKILKAPNVTYTAIGKQTTLPEVIPTTLPNTREELINYLHKYDKVFTPDDFLIILGISHSTLFKIIGNMVVNGTFTYKPESGPGKWSYYDYYWLAEVYSRPEVKIADAKKHLNRNSSQIKIRAHSVGFSKKKAKPVNVTNKPIMFTPSNSGISEERTQLTEVKRDYIISQIQNVVDSILQKGI